ncbi:MAG: hypothetical protein ACLRSW_08845 [Christensenellaceae bacterium]
MGTYDKEVKAAIEEKFFRDTGESISLQIEAVGTGEAGNKMGQAMASPSVQLDGFAFHYGGDSPLNGYILDDAAMDLTDCQSLAPEFFKYHNTAEYDPDGLSYYAGVYKDKLYSLSSQEYTSGCNGEGIIWRTPISRPTSTIWPIPIKTCPFRVLRSALSVCG